MDPIINPYAPGAGSPPPELAGRDHVREKMHICIERLRRAKPAKSLMLVGLRGVGKTVLLDQMLKDAEAAGALTIRIEAPEEKSLPAALVPQLRLGLLKLSLGEKSKVTAIRALRALAGFVGKMKMVYNDIEVGIDFDPEPGLADNGDLEGDLTALLEQVGRAARDGETVVAIFIDELQYVAESQMGALISALHRCAQLQLPLVVAGAGLPQLPARMGNAKSYAERLFEFPAIGPLEAADAAAPDQKRHDLESDPWRHGIHRAAV